jgi:NADPH:quinone reductase
MFTRSVFQIQNMEVQHDLLAPLAQMIEKDQIRKTLAEMLGPINVANLTGAHDRIRQRRVPGVMVMVGF